MSRAAAVPVIARLKAGMLGAVAACGRVWGRASVVAVLMTLSLTLLGEGAPGDLDPSFGGDGKVTTDFGGGDDEARAVVLQPDGKIVVAGGSSMTESSGLFGLARYHPNGTLDTTFGGTGLVTTDVGSGIASAVALQADGKIVVAGGSSNPLTGPSDFALARYLPSGTLDTTFGGTGLVTTDFGGFHDIAFAVALQPDGKIVAAGEAINLSTGNRDFALVRYLPNGTLDTTFGSVGRVTTAFGRDAPGADVALQPDGKIVVAGSVGFPPDIALARYLPSGTLDTTFGGDGRVITDVGDFEFATAVALQPDGKIIAAGYANSNNVAGFALVRYLPNGTLDTTFGGDGLVITDVGGTASDLAFALAIQPHDGRLVVAGRAIINDSLDFALTRYESSQLVNDFVTFEPIQSTFAFTPNSTGCPAGFVGKFSFEARLTNTSESSLTDLVVGVTTLTNGNLLQNADGGPGGVGAQLTVPPQDDFTDGVLSPEELVDVLFRICLHERQPFTFVVDVFGVVDVSIDAQARAQLAR